jgi:hypothetical protein
MQALVLNTQKPLVVREVNDSLSLSPSPSPSLSLESQSGLGRIYCGSKKSVPFSYLSLPRYDPLNPTNS